MASKLSHQNGRQGKLVADMLTDEEIAALRSSDVRLHTENKSLICLPVSAVEELLGAHWESKLRSVGVFKQRSPRSRLLGKEEQDDAVYLDGTKLAAVPTQEKTHAARHTSRRYEEPAPFVLPLNGAEAEQLLRYRPAPPKPERPPVVMPEGVVQMPMATLEHILGKHWKERFALTQEKLEQPVLLKSDFFTTPGGYALQADIDRAALQSIVNGPAAPEELALLMVKRLGGPFVAIDFGRNPPHTPEGKQPLFCDASYLETQVLGSNWRERLEQTPVEFSIETRSGKPCVFFPADSLYAFTHDALHAMKDAAPTRKR